MSEVKPVLWVNSDDLNNRNFVGINAVKEGHMDLGRYYTIPLVSFDDHERAVKALRAENERLRRESEGRLAALHDKAEEAKHEWLRAERAEARVAELERAVARVRARIDALMLEHCPDEMTPEQVANHPLVRELIKAADRVRRASPGEREPWEHLGAALDALAKQKPGDGARVTEAVLREARCVVSYLDHASMDTSKLPGAMGAALRRLRESLDALAAREGGAS